MTSLVLLPPDAAFAGYIDTTPFWSHARERKLFVQYCFDTDRFQHPPRPVSQYTGSRNLGWREAIGRGRVHSWIIQNGAATDDRVSHRPTLVDMDDGFRFLSWYVGEDELQHGMAVVVSWALLADGRSWPAFTNADV
ncbi:Zn-ribbon domain-containing OB-fold protein [Bradyrhizobium sp. RD5-C2]|uniref:Zn-ribbon domain-containing OB-fold protein n=1 Tax=Bradyrhizobium sp. RD5-C2 TaxID=244562 RepID=UPI001CC4C4E5|nr:OB-fold domain-containing protein [Bradyrhizobium sp. RD5-C2]GIQ78264.1 hypothetical protein BraRD5C2_67140 [Bradyrhizobium sp. RD5-C2]